jgi:uncharacterized protein (TIGR02996 family)
MSEGEALFRAVRASPKDDALRLIYADWLEEQGDVGPAELVRVCQAMRELPVFSDEYWQLKARRNELRPQCPADWLAATGYDGSRYDPVYRHGVPDDWKGRWRLIRAFTECWHGLPMGDVGGRGDEIRAEEERLGRQFPPSLREYVAYAHDVAPPGDFGRIHRDFYTLQPLEGHPALSIMVIAEGEYHWAVGDDDFRHPDPPITEYYGPPEDVRQNTADVMQPLSEFVLGFVAGYSPNAGTFSSNVREPTWLQKQLEGAFPIRVRWGQGTTWEGDGILVSLGPAHGRPGFYLSVRAHRLATWERLPEFLWLYARFSGSRSGMFLSEEDRERSLGHWGDNPPPEVLEPAPPPLRGPAGGVPPGLRAEVEDDIPF